MQKFFDIVGLLLFFSLGIRLTPEAEAALLDLLAEILDRGLCLFH